MNNKLLDDIDQYLTWQARRRAFLRWHLEWLEGQRSRYLNDPMLRSFWNDGWIGPGGDQDIKYCRKQLPSPSPPSSSSAPAYQMTPWPC